MAMSALFLGEWNEVHIPVAHASQRHELLGEGLRRLDGPAHEHGFQAVGVIEMNLRGRDHQIVMLVLQFGYLLRRGPVVMIVDITDAGGTPFRPVFLQTDMADLVADEIPHGFGAIDVAPLAYEGVELLCELIVQRDGEALHEKSPSKSSSLHRWGNMTGRPRQSHRWVRMRRSNTRSIIHTSATNAINSEPPVIIPRR